MCQYGIVTSSTVQQSYGLQDKAVLEPGGTRLDAVVLWMPADRAACGWSNLGPVDLLLAPLGVEDLHGWQLYPGDVISSFITL